MLCQVHVILHLTNPFEYPLGAAKLCAKMTDHLSPKQTFILESSITSHPMTVIFLPPF